MWAGIQLATAGSPCCKVITQGEKAVYIKVLSETTSLGRDRKQEGVGAAADRFGVTSRHFAYGGLVWGFPTLV